MKYNGNNLKEVLAAHRRWVYESDCMEGNSYADFEGANLRGADLRFACLRLANFQDADLTGANLGGADLRMADFRGACLRQAVLDQAILKDTFFEEADLEDVSFRSVYVNGAYFENAKNLPFIPMVCPETGAFVAWKKCASKSGQVIVKLLVPEDAKRSSGTGRKCRSEKAVVLEIQTKTGKPRNNVQAWSLHDKKFVYEVGKTVVPREPFCEERFKECESGIHFFMHRQEAVEYLT